MTSVGCWKVHTNWHIEVISVLEIILINSKRETCTEVTTAYPCQNPILPLICLRSFQKISSVSSKESLLLKVHYTSATSRQPKIWTLSKVRIVLFRISDQSRAYLCQRLRTASSSWRCSLLQVHCSSWSLKLRHFRIFWWGCWFH